MHVGNVDVRRVEKKGNRLVHAVIKTYSDASRFWAYEPEQQQPFFTRLPAFTLA